MYNAYLFVFIQPILIILGRYFLYRRIDPFYMYTDLCVLCDGKLEYYINFLKITFYSVSIAIFAPFFHKSKLFDYLYFIGFYSLSIYIFTTSPFNNLILFKLFFWLCQFEVLVTIIKIFPKFFKPKLKT